MPKKTMGGLTPTAKMLDRMNKQQELLSGLTPTTKMLDRMNKQQELLSGLTPTTKMLDRMNKQQELLSGLTTTTKMLDRMNKQQELFKNIIVPKEIVMKSFPNVNVKNSDVNKIFSKVSPDKYTFENKFQGNDFHPVIVKNDTSEKMSVEAVISTISSVDLLRSVTEDEALSFYLHLAEFPMLGLDHEVGRKILDEVDKFKTVTIQNEVLYRARDRNVFERQHPYTQNEMYAAPPGRSAQGRFNLLGQGELYTCDNMETAIKECAKQDDTAIDVIEFELLEEVDMINLTDENHPLVKYCSFNINDPSGIAYLVPNFIAQCAKRNKIDGLVYKSVQDSHALNYVFFDYKKGWFLTKNLISNVDVKQYELDSVTSP